MHLFLLFVAVGPPVWAFLLMALVLLTLHFNLPQKFYKFVHDRTYRTSRAIQLFRRTGWGWLLYLAPVSGGMPGTVIGTQMNLGYPGTYSRNGDCIIEQKPVTAADASGPNFGSAVVLVQSATGGSFTDAAVAKAAAHSLVMTQGANYCFAGVVVREVKTLTSYVVQPGASAVLANYTPGQICDVLVRGSVVVQIQNPSAAAVVAGGSVFIRLVAGTGTVIGAFEPVADGGNTVQLTNCYFTTGLTSLDANGNTVAEITLITRNIP